MAARRRFALALGCLALTLATSAGCAGGAGDDDVPPMPEDLVPFESADAPSCWPAGTREFTGGTAADQGSVVVLGEGDLGIVLAPQASETFCGWADEAERLVGEGYVVASFTWTDDGAVAVRAAVAALRAEADVGPIVLMGASKGGAYAAAMADETAPFPSGVIALSPPAEFGVDARAEGSSFEGPLLVIASSDDTSVDVEDSRLVARAAEPDTFVELSGSAHGWDLFDGEHAAEVEALIDDFLVEAFAAEDAGG
jgi:dienelactone hydrolase